MAKINNIEFNNFRNFTHLKTSFDNKLNILFGNNGSGKTNILEGISLIAKGRGLRNTNFINLIKSKKEYFKIYNNVEIKDNNFDVTIYPKKNNERYKKIIEVNNDMSKESIEFLYKSISILTFLPEMERLFQSSPSYRRNFIDRLIFSSSKGYNKLINKYKKLLIERFKILQASNFDNSWLDQIEKEISSSGFEIYNARNFQLNLINDNLAKLNNTNKYKFVVNLRINDNFFNSGLDIDKYITELNKSRYFDKKNGSTKIGPHRTDIQAIIDGDYDASLLSTGQQKTVVLMILIAQCQYLINDYKIEPILLFDEICSHLDSFNRQILLDMINNLDIQFFLTGTDKNLFSFVSTKAKFYNISSL